MRIPKLRGFKRRGRIEYEIVNVGAIDAAVERGVFQREAADAAATKGKSKGPAQITINQDVLRLAGLVRSLDKPLKVLGAGELNASLFVVADAFTSSARTKIEAAGGTVSVLEVPTAPMKALGVDADAAEADAAQPESGSTDAKAPAVEPTEAEPAEARQPSKRRKGKAATAEADEPTSDEETTSEAAAADPEAAEDQDEESAASETPAGDVD
jgi:ribosomal protein L15